MTEVTAPFAACSQQTVQQQQRDADVDGGVGEVEHEEVPPERVQIEEIDDCAERQAVDGVAERAADDRPNSRPDHQIPGFPQPDAKQPGRCQREADQQRNAGLRVLREEAERNTRVEPEVEVQERPERRRLRAHAREAVHDEELARLIKREHRHRDRRAEPPSAAHAARAMGPSAPARRVA